MRRINDTCSLLLEVCFCPLVWITQFLNSIVSIKELDKLNKYLLSLECTN